MFLVEVIYVMCFFLTIASSRLLLFHAFNQLLRSQPEHEKRRVPAPGVRLAPWNDPEDQLELGRLKSLLAFAGA